MSMQSSQKIYKEYLKSGLVLVRIAPRSKAPRSRGWSQLENCICEPSDLARLNGHNVGVAHVYSHTCAIDIDDLKKARKFFDERGVDIDQYLNASDAVRIESGRNNRAKLFYALPHGVESLSTIKRGGIELRCAARNGNTLQDVLPPSIHPDTGQPYGWVGDWRQRPVLPDELLRVWKSLLGNSQPKSNVIIQEGERNTRLVSVAGGMRRHGMDHEAINTALLKQNAAQCDPPLPESEVNRIAISVAKWHPATHETDLGNAERLVKAHGEDLRFCTDYGKWLYWDKTRWLIDDKAQTRVMPRATHTVRTIYLEVEVGNEPDDQKRKKLSAWAGQSESEQRLKAMISLARSLPGVSITVAELDCDPWLLNCLNGTLDLHTGALHAHRRADYLTKLVDVVFDPEARCVLWEKFLARVMNGDSELIGFLRRAVGYSLTGLTIEHCVLFMHGTGRNGKSTFSETLMTLLGDYAQKVPTEMLMVKRFGSGIPNDIARLPGVRVAVASEVEDGRRMAESVVKDLCGGDTITARLLHQEYFDFKPTHKLWMYGNHKPVIYGNDEAIWSRIRLIPFEVFIQEKDRDLGLVDKLRAELPGILNWAIQGCLEWQAKGLQPPRAVEKATQSYRAEMDVLQEWIDECCKVSRPTPQQ